MSWVDPRALRKGDVVSPRFNPLLRIRVDPIGLTTLATLNPNHHPDLAGTTPIRLILGTRFGTDHPDQLALSTTARVWPARPRRRGPAVRF